MFIQAYTSNKYLSDFFTQKDAKAETDEQRHLGSVKDVEDELSKPKMPVQSQR